jgi:two-component system nitrogen regulation sensor histidine kinase NtrY
MSQTIEAIKSRSLLPLAVYDGKWHRRIMPGVLVVVAALLAALFSFLVLIGQTPIEPNEKATLWLVAVNGFFIALLAGLIAREIYRIVESRRTVKAASRLHVRIILLFSAVAAVPAIAVAIFASITLGIGLDRWFETRTKDIVNSSTALAEAYIEENARNLQGTTISMAFDLDKAKAIYSLDRNGFQQLMSRQAVGRALAGAWLLRGDGKVELDASVPNSENLPPAPVEALKTAADGKPVLIPPRTRNLVGAIFKLREIDGLYLYTIRAVDPKILETLSIMQANTKEYHGLEANRFNTQIAFALLYITLTFIVLLSAIWTAIAVADRMVRPIRQLIGAADEVAAGNLDVAVPVRSSDGDVGSLANTFNKMTEQLKSQREELLSAKDQIDERRRFSEAVLSGVTAGVIGVDPEGRISIVNRSAEHMFGLHADEVNGEQLEKLIPSLKNVFDAARRSGRPVYRDHAVIFTAGTERTFNIQITLEKSESSAHSYVVTIDDITDLVAAQRSSAWADVARRIAHEIKNPLTPIQLSAERIKRRYGRMVEDDRAVFDQCTDTIIRQVGDIGRMVDEFSAFARMPKPTMVTLDLREALREATFLAELRREDVEFKREFGEEPLIGTFDSRLVGQAVGNIIKNAAEAIEPASLDSGRLGRIEIRAHRTGTEIMVDVIDNGKGLPRENRQRLLEPYMTTREKGTGLGLAIVKKVVEDHHGRLELHDAPKDFDQGRGAMIRMIFPAGEIAGTEKLKSPKLKKSVSEQA